MVGFVLVKIMGKGPGIFKNEGMRVYLDIPRVLPGYAEVADLLMKRIIEVLKTKGTKKTDSGYVIFIYHDLLMADIKPLKTLDPRSTAINTTGMHTSLLMKATSYSVPKTELIPSASRTSTYRLGRKKVVGLWQRTWDLP